MDGPFDAERFESLRLARRTSLGHALFAREETGSTNDDAAAAAREGAAHGALFVAEAQHRGRGRRGHTWSSPPRQNLTFSLVLRPALPPPLISSLTLVAGAAVRVALAARVAAPVRVKWPNDVVVRRRKIAGILVESQLRADRVEAVIVGVGINVKMRALPAEIASIATSLALEGAEPLDRETVLLDVLTELESRLATHERLGVGPVVEELRSHDALLGEHVWVDDVTGVGAGLGDDGSLLVETPDGQLVAVSSGTVRW